MYNAALVMGEQLKAIGMTVKIEVSDWPTVRKKQQDKSYAWNIYFTGFGTGPAVGASGALLDLIPPTRSSTLRATQSSSRRTRTC